MKVRLFRLPGSVKRNPSVDAWMRECPADLGAIPPVERLQLYIFHAHPDKFTTYTSQRAGAYFATGWSSIE